MNGNHDISEDEIKRFLGEMRKSAAPGPNKLSIEALKIALQDENEAAQMQALIGQL